MTSLTFYGGVREIGGNKILLEEGDTRLFFDFGTSFHKRSLFFEEYLKPRVGCGLLDLLETGILPPLQGVYRHDLEPGPGGLWERYQSDPCYRDMRGLKVDGVLLSHAHIDHTGGISFLREDIPVYASTMTAFIAKAMQDSGNSDFEKEVCYCNPRSAKEGYLSTTTKDAYRRRPFVFLDGLPSSAEARAFWGSSPAKTKKLELAPVSHSPQKIGGLPLRYFPVDHSVFGAEAFAVETAQGWLAYSGDLRLHTATQRFIDEIERLHPAILICEGTRSGDSRVVSEEEVALNTSKAVKETSGMVIADFGPRNVERLITFHRVARENNRKLVILAKDAYLLDAMALLSTDIPNNRPDILLYKELKGRSFSWEEKVQQSYGDKMVEAAQIRADPAGFILCFSFWDINELVDIGCRGGIYIYSSSEVFDEEGAMDMKRLRHWLEHFEIEGVGLPVQTGAGSAPEDWKVPEAERGFHSSGHAAGTQILELIKQVKPKVLVPVHTEDPDYFKSSLEGTGIEVRNPEYGKAMTFPG